MTDEVASEMDQLILRLRELRARAGNPSFADIVSKVTAARLERGMSEFEARVARSTVYDLFRFGRRRMDETLLIEVVRTLGATVEDADAWRADVAAATRQSGAGAPNAVELPSLAQGHATQGRLTTRWAIVLMLGCWVLNVLGA